jgi:chaperonin cofactor prefoldin
MANHLVKVSHKLQQLQQELSTCNAERDTLHATLTENSRHEALERDRILAAMKHELENVVGEREHLQEFSNKVLQANEALERELRGLKEDMAGESELSMLKQQL